MKKRSSQSTLESSQITTVKDEDVIITQPRITLSGHESFEFLQHNPKTHNSHKNYQLRQSIYKQLKKMQEMCQNIKQKTATNKTLKNNLIQTSQTAKKRNSVSKERPFQKKQGFSLHKTSPVESKINAPSKYLQRSVIQMSTEPAKPRKPIRHLNEIREIQSFFMEQNEEVQISRVQQHCTSSTQYLDHLLSKSTQAQFSVLKLIEERLFQKTFIVRNNINHTLYTIKSINKITMDQHMMHQLITEIKIQSFLNHININKLYHIFGDQNYIYLVMEPCSGKTLSQKLKETGRMEQFLVRDLIKQLCSALQYMHQRGITHGQIKPKNIFLNQTIIKLTNFERANYHIQSLKPKCLTDRQNLFFKPNEQQQDKKFDILSMGALTYQLLYGSQNSCLLDFDQIAMRVKTTKIEFPKDIQVSEAGKSFISSCLNKNSKQTQTIRQLSQHQFLKKMERTQKYRWTMA